MRNLWKWILGILIVLVVGAGLFGLGFVLHNRMAADVVHRTVIRTPRSAPDGPRVDKIPDRFKSGPFRVGPRINIQRFGHGGFVNRFAPGLMLFGFLGRLIPLAILFLLLYIAYQLGTRKTAPTAAAPPEPLPVAPTTPCPKCESPVQAEWKHCPNCGEELSVS